MTQTKNNPPTMQAYIVTEGQDDFWDWTPIGTGWKQPFDVYTLDLDPLPVGTRRIVLRVAKTEQAR